MEGVEVYEGSVRFARAVCDAGLATAVVSASANCADVLAAAGIADLFEVRVDGVVAASGALRGKPAPDTFLAAAGALGVAPHEAAGVRGRAARVSRRDVRAGSASWSGSTGRAGGALRAHGADIVVADLARAARVR